MVRLVPIEKHPIPMVLLVNMHLIKRVRLFSHVVWLGTGQFQWSIGTNRTIGTNGPLELPCTQLDHMRK